jgi:hypothetical protein
VKTLKRYSLFTALSLLLPLQLQSAVTLVTRGRSDYRIILPTSPLPSETYAAEELQKYIRKVTGVNLEIRSEAEKPTKYEIVLGSTERSASLGVQIDLASLGPDGYVLKTQGNLLLIAGGRPRGTLNGVYSFLEEKVGIRWFTPELETCPRTNRLVLPALDEEVVPSLENREVFWTEAMRDADFAARHRLNGNHYKLSQKHGGRFAVYFPFVHSFDLLIPPELYKEHPEFFPLIDGKRVDGYVQRCLSNPDVLRISKERVRQWIKEHPEATIISVSQNDAFKNCRCESCKTLDDAEGSPAASLLKFVNAIAEDLEADFPNVRIDTLAYQYTRKPPKTIRPRRNVIVRLCSIECCFAHPLASCSAEENRRFRNDIIAWQAVAPLLYVWDYTPNFAHYQQPFPNFDALQPNVRFYVEHNVKGLFEQGNYSPGGFGELGPLRAYLLAKLLWNPKTDLRKHQEEFCAAYYGPAAPGIQAYLDLLQNQVRNGEPHAHIFDSPKAAYLGAKFIGQADEILRRAESASQDPDVHFRVQVARLPVWYVQLATGRLTGAERNELLTRFLSVARKAGISHISESQSLEDWARKQQG